MSKSLQVSKKILQELKEADKDWEKNGGLSLDEMKRKYHLEPPPGIEPGTTALRKHCSTS